MVICLIYTHNISLFYSDCKAICEDFQHKGSKNMADLLYLCFIELITIILHKIKLCAIFEDWRKLIVSCDEDKSHSRKSRKQAIAIHLILNMLNTISNNTY